MRECVYVWDYDTPNQYDSLGLVLHLMALGGALLRELLIALWI